MAKKRGFASMDPAKQREIASKGGKAAHQKGTAHEFTPEEAREAGRKGGQAAHGRGTAHKFTPEEAREAGRKGGRSARASSTGAASSNQTPTPEMAGAGQGIGNPPLPNVRDFSPESRRTATMATTSQQKQPAPPFPAQSQAKPGNEAELVPRPRYEAPLYRGSGKLQGKTALITGGDSGIGRA